MVADRPIVLKNSVCWPLMPAREISDRVERPRIDDRRLGRGSMTPETVASHCAEEFFKCKGLPRPDATLKSHGIECQD